MTPQQFKQVFSSIRPQDRGYAIIFAILWLMALTGGLILTGPLGTSLWFVAAVMATAFWFYSRHRSATDPDLPLQIVTGWILVILAGVISYKCIVHPAAVAAFLGWNDPRDLQLVQVMFGALFAALVPVFWHLAYTKIQLMLGSKKIKGRKAHDIFS
jgi:hypothetical protein